MTEPIRRLRPAVLSAAFLAVAVLLCGMSYVTYDTRQQVQASKQERADLRSKVSALQRMVDELTEENRRLTDLLITAGMDPRPSASASPASPTRPAQTRPSPAARSSTTATPTPGSTSASRRPSSSPRPRPGTSATPSPSPSPCVVRNPVDGRCLP